MDARTKPVRVRLGASDPYRMSWYEFGALIAGVWVVLTMSVAFDFHKQWRHGQISSQGNGEIYSNELVVRQGRRSKSYRADVSYQYSIGGREYLSSRLFYGDSSSSRRRAEARFNRFAVGQKVDVWIDPRDPSESTLYPGLTVWNIQGIMRFAGLVLFWGTCVLVSVIRLIAFWFGRFESRRVAKVTQEPTGPDFRFSIGLSTVFLISIWPGFEALDDALRLVFGYETSLSRVQSWLKLWPVWSVLWVLIAIALKIGLRRRAQRAGNAEGRGRSRGALSGDVAGAPLQSVGRDGLVRDLRD